jgi:hypothetical protein
MLSRGSTPRARPARQASPRLGGGRAIAAPALPYLVPLAGALVASASGVLSLPALAAVAVSAIGCALVRAAAEHIRIEMARDCADRWIGVRAGQPPSDEILLARIDELLSADTRTTLGRAFRRVATDAAGTGRPISPAQLNRRRLRRHADDLVRLADRLEDMSSPVTPRGVALAHRLVTEGGGPLYNARTAETLPVSLRAALRALDLDPPARER